MVGSLSRKTIDESASPLITFLTLLFFQDGVLSAFSLKGSISAIGLPCLVICIDSPFSTAENKADAFLRNSVNVTALIVSPVNVHCVQYSALLENRFTRTFRTYEIDGAAKPHPVYQDYSIRALTLDKESLCIGLPSILLRVLLRISNVG